THTVVWDFGDSSTASGSLTPSHVYADNGTYTVTLTVTDKDGGFDSDTLIVTVNNVAPTVEAGLDQMANEGSPVDFNGSFTDPGSIDTHTLAWDFGDGATASNTLTPTHVYADNGVYTVTLAITDNDGGMHSDTLVITVHNVAPTVEAGPDLAAIRYEAVTFNGSVVDPGPVDTHTIVWTFGDGTTVVGTLSPTHVYSQSGVYTVTLAVLDDDSGLGGDTLHVFVTNVAPAVDAGPDQDTEEASTVNFHGTFTGTGTLDRYVVTWDFGDGATASSTLTPAHVYADNGTYTVTLTISDDDGLVGSDTLRLSVSNIAPTVYAGPNQTAVEGSVVSFNGAFTDPGVLDTHSIWWNFGDGEMSSGTLTPTHAYADNGTYTVTLSVFDDDGGVGADVLLVTVSNADPMVNAVADQAALEGAAVHFAGSFTDPGSIDTHTIEWDFGDGATTIGTLTPDHVYADNGTYTATHAVTDQGGGVAVDTVMIT
ncbi:hypothetical protein PLCT1_00142, partial [Planctomycetaceae bacterium]